MLRSGAGDPRALGELHRRLRPRLLAVAMRVTQSRAEAEDAVQEAFSTAWRTGAHYRPGLGTVYTWLASIVRHKGIDGVRKRASVERRVLLAASFLAGEFHVVADGGEVFASAENKGAVRSAVLTLPPGEQQAIVLSFFEGLSHGEIARELDLPLGTVKARIRRGMEKLRPALRYISAA